MNEEKKRKLEKYLKELKSKIVNDDYDAIDEGRGIWPYMGSHCGYSYEDKCIMCTNGCDFY